MFQKKFIGELKISGKVNDKWQLGVGVRNDDLILLSILNKAIQNLSTQQTQKILNNYIGIKYEKGFDYSLFWKIFTFFIILIFVLLIRNRNINSYNEKIKKYLEMIDNHVLISSTDKDGFITEVSNALCKLTGYTKKELIGQNHNIFRHKDMDKAIFKTMWETILSGKTWNGEIKNIKKDGTVYWINAKITPDFNKYGNIKGFTAIRENITDKKILEKTTLTDSLTQIPNRLYLDNNYKIELERAKRYKSVFSIIIMDIDLFKNVNDTYGHQVGDKVLIEIAIILKNNIRKLDILGRWGGEEFVIICPEVNASQSEMFAKKIKDIIEYYDFSTVRSITCSFGISQYIYDDTNEETFKRADKALYMAKNSGRNKVIIV
jgi:diguanylate cyclase (GGDEF)-like protein/PAS domain S-box-containing protein